MTLYLLYCASADSAVVSSSPLYSSHAEDSGTESPTMSCDWVDNDFNTLQVAALAPLALLLVLEARCA